MTTEKGYWDRYWRRRLTRRQALKGAALGTAGLSVALVVGCDDDGDQQAAATATPPSDESPAATPTAMEDEPKRGGVVTHVGGRVGSADTQGIGLDPHIIRGGIFVMTFRAVYQGLLKYDPRTNESQAELAAEWETPSETEYIFQLQPGAKWHNKPPVNGRNLTADDVVFSLERLRSPEPQFQSRSLIRTVDQIEAMDPSAVRLTTTRPDAALLARLASDAPLILAPEVIDSFDKLATADQMIGTGPFVATSIEERAGSQYERNPDYWKEGQPYLDGYRTAHFEDEEAAYAAWRGGQLDITRLNGQRAQEYIADQGAGFTPDWYKDTTAYFALPNVRSAPMNDPRVTRALRLLVDHDEMITWAETWFGRGQYGSIFPTTLQDQWDLTQDEYKEKIYWKQPKDEAIAEALQLLSAAGFTADNPLQFELSGNQGSFAPAVTQLLQDQWKRLGQGVVDASIQLYDIATVGQKQTNNDFTYFSSGVSVAMNEPDDWLNTIYVSEGSRNIMGLSDPTLDQMIEKQGITLDQNERQTLIKEIIEYMIDNSPGIIFANRFMLNAVNPDIRNYAPEFFMIGHQYEDVWLAT